MKTKRVVSVILASGMILSCFTGCGTEKVTAEDLVNNAYGSDGIKSLDADLSLDIDLDFDASAIIGLYGDSTDESDSSSKTMMNLAVGFDGNMKATSDLAYVGGSANIGIFGTKTEVKAESYTDIKNQVSYTYDADSDVWAKTDITDASQLFDTDSLDKYMSSDILTDLVLVNGDDKKADTYEVTGVASYESIKDALGDKADELFSGYDVDGTSANVTMNFDRKTKQIKDVTVTVDPDSVNSDDFVINQFEIKVTVNALNEDVNLEIPKDVIDNCVESGSINIDEGFGIPVDDSDYDATDIDSSSEDETSDFDSIESETASNPNEKTLSQFYFESDSLSSEDVKQILSYYYSGIDNMNQDAFVSFASFMNDYTFTTFDANLDAYDSWGSEDKIALAIMYDLGIVDDSLLYDHNVSTDNVQSYVDIYIEPYR